MCIKYYAIGIVGIKYYALEIDCVYKNIMQ